MTMKKKNMILIAFKVMGRQREWTELRWPRSFDS